MELGLISQWSGLLMDPHGPTVRSQQKKWL